MRHEQPRPPELRTYTVAERHAAEIQASRHTLGALATYGEQVGRKLAALEMALAHERIQHMKQRERADRLAEELEEMRVRTGERVQ